MSAFVVISQFLLYELLDIFPCAILALAPFRTMPHSRARLVGTVLALYFFGVLRRLLAFYIPASAGLLSLLWIGLYLTAFHLIHRAALSKMLFVLITVLNFASHIFIFYNYIGNILFHNQLRADPYGSLACLCLGLTWLAFFPLQYWLVSRLTPLISKKENENIWRFLWLMPATFCVFFYYNLYHGNSISFFLSNGQNFAFAMAISAGFFFVLSLVMRLVRENNLVLQLRAENYQFSLQTLQYQSLQERIEETCRARHDLRQCMTVIQSYLQHGNRTELERFASSYCATLPPDNPILYSRNAALNAVLSYYAQRALREKIPFTCHVNYPEATTIADTEIVVLVGNMLENAVDACAQQTQPEKFIRLSVQMQGGALVVILSNSYTGDPVSGALPLHSAKHAGKGIGLASVRKIAEKHRGTASFEGDGKVFRSSVTLF